jgi:DNA-binding protein HU-beta
VNKSELIDAVAVTADLPKAAAARAIDAMTDAIAASLKSGQSVSLVGFGSFNVKDRPARTGRNPQTGAPIQIAAARVPSFKAGKALKDAVNSWYNPASAWLVLLPIVEYRHPATGRWLKRLERRFEGTGIRTPNMWSQVTAFFAIK